MNVGITKKRRVTRRNEPLLAVVVRDDVSLSHLLVRRDGILCTRCATVEPVHPGSGTPMVSLLDAYNVVWSRHKRCKP